MTVRKELERWVVAMNKNLREVVADMDIIILLRNCTPSYRSDFALRLYREKVITLEQAKEFSDSKAMVTARLNNY